MKSTHGPLVVVLSDVDPVASRIAELWGAYPASEYRVDGTPVRERLPGVLYVRTSTLHIHDERFDHRLPAGLLATSPTLVFPSVHRSEQNVRCLAVHPLGNPGPEAELGGRPRTLVPTDPHRMTAALRLLEEGGRRLNLKATFEATHHGPELGVPAFFLEIGFGELARPADEEVAVLEQVLLRLTGEAAGRTAVGIGGGHYVPHFTDLALKRRWSFGHLLSRHVLGELDRATAESALQGTPDAEGLLFARSVDADLPALRSLAPRLREGDAERRNR